MATNGRPSDDVLETLRLSEGFRGKPYRDTVGIWTVGYGFNLEALQMPLQVAELWLNILVEDLYKKCAKEFGFWNTLSSSKTGCFD
jgi:hypothetical protein